MALALVGAPAAAVMVAPAHAQAPQESEAQRLTAFLDQEFQQELAMRPQLATRLGS